MLGSRTNEELLSQHLTTGRELLNRLRNAVDANPDVALCRDVENEMIALAAKWRRGYNDIYPELLKLQQKLERAALTETSFEGFNTL